jgi:hypothetical protein
MASNNAFYRVPASQTPRPLRSNPHSAAATPLRPLIAVSSLGGFRTPAAGVRRTARARPASENLHTYGLIAPQQTKPLFDDLVRAAERRERETTVTSGHATLATRGHYPLLGPDFHRLDRTSLRLVHSLDYLVGERA